MQPRTTNYRKPEGIPRLFEGKILLVDDDVQDLKFHFMIFHQHGYQVVACDSYAEAVRMLNHDDFDLVVLNQSGPVFEGQCVLERARRGDQDTPVLVLANHADMGVYLKVMELGAADYIEKGIASSVLVPIIKGYLRPTDRLRVAATSQAKGASIAESRSVEGTGLGEP
jgi:DNA-binding response OmpR family regulator